MNLLYVILRFGFLLLLWVFVAGVVLTVRRDTRGPVVKERRVRRKRDAGYGDVASSPMPFDQGAPATPVASPPAPSVPATPAPAPASVRRRSAFQASDAPGKPLSNGHRSGAHAENAPRPALLRVITGEDAGKQITLSGNPVVIGRSADCTLVLADSYASARHARVFQGSDGQWWVDDLDSTNGTFMNGRPIEVATPLRPGDQLVVGDTAIELVP